MCQDSCTVPVMGTSHLLCQRPLILPKWLRAWERLLGRERGGLRPPLLTAHPTSALSLQEPTRGAERLVEGWGAGAGLTGTSDILQALRGCLTQRGAGDCCSRPEPGKNGPAQSARSGDPGAGLPVWLRTHCDKMDRHCPGQNRDGQSVSTGEKSPGGDGSCARP